MRFCLLLFWSPAFSGFQEPFPAGGGADVWAGADNEVGEQCCTAFKPVLLASALLWWTKYFTIRVSQLYGTD